MTLEKIEFKQIIKEFAHIFNHLKLKVNYTLIFWSYS